MLKRRATLVQTVTRMKQSVTDLGPLQADVDALIEHCRTTIKKLDQALLAQAKALGAGRHKCVVVRGFQVSDHSLP